MTPKTDALEARMYDEGLERTFRTDYLFAELRHRERENAALRADAERYRWLRNAARTVDYSAWLDVDQSMYQTGCRHSGGQLDEAIDNFIARQPHSQGGCDCPPLKCLRQAGRRCEFHGDTPNPQSMEGSGNA